MMPPPLVMMNEEIAGQVAQLLNERNELVKRYDAKTVLAAKENYLFELADDGSVSGCAELKRVQWYQCEISHLSVHKDSEGKGVAWILLKRAEEKAKSLGGRVLQCTIREGNGESLRFFERNGFLLVGKFNYSVSGNNVGIWQKILSPRLSALAHETLAVAETGGSEG